MKYTLKPEKHCSKLNKIKQFSLCKLLTALNMLVCIINSKRQIKYAKLIFGNTHFENPHMGLLHSNCIAYMVWNGLGDKIQLLPLFQPLGCILLTVYW
jgi:hypothetical protein